MVSRRFAAGFAFIAVLLFSAGTVIAQQSYEGLATVGSFGRFPTGLFGASNLVPPNTLVTVRNLETGRSERVIVTDSVRESGVFLVLSPEAAESLEIDPGGATRVRLTEIATGGVASVDSTTERALSQDPDINPLAAADSLVDALPPPQPVAGTADEALEPAPALQDAAAEQPEPEPEPEPESAPEPAKPEREKPAVAEAEPRSGVAAGIARTSVGQAQESFERPETAFPSARPEPVDVPSPAEPGEPLVAPEERAVPGLAQAVPETRPEPTLPADEPQPPAPERPAVRAEGAEATEYRDGAIDTALRSVVDRLPRKDLYPAPVGERGDVGFRSVGRPDEPPAIAELPQVSPPPVERPSLAGLAPLQAAPEDLDVRLAEATVPPEDRPNYEGLAAPPTPAEGTPAVRLPEAAPGEDARPTGPGLARIVPGDAADPRGPFAEAEAPEEERAELADIPSAEPPVRPSTPAELAEARPEPEERPDDSLAGTSPGEPAELAAEPELPRVAEEEVGEETAETEDSLERPEAVPEDAILALEPADFRPPEAPEPDEESILEREDAGPAAAGDDIETADLAEARPRTPETAVTEAPERAAPAEPPRADEREPEAEPERAPEPRPGREVVRDDLPVVDRLAAEAYYLQIGAYSNPETARVAVNALSPTYPMSVLPLERDDRTIYRVLVGPLERDETGTLLVWLRARGYSDTFVRGGTEL